jgi:hypothetical protein
VIAIQRNAHAQRAQILHGLSRQLPLAGGVRDMLGTAVMWNWLEQKLLP